VTRTWGLTRTESKYGSSDPIKSPTSYIPTISKPKPMPCIRRVHYDDVHRSVRYCDRSDGGAGIPPDPSESTSRMPSDHFQDTRLSVL
jgi:hypothetical protein